MGVFKGVVVPEGFFIGDNPKEKKQGKIDVKGFFSLEKFRMSVVEFKEDVVHRKKELEDVNKKVEEYEGKVNDINQCVTTLKSDMEKITNKIDYLRNWENLLLEDYEKAIKKRDEGIRLLEEKKRLYNDLVGFIDKEHIKEKRMEIYKVNQNNSKIEKEIKQLSSKIHKIKEENMTTEKGNDIKQIFNRLKERVISDVPNKKVDIIANLLNRKLIERPI